MASFACGNSLRRTVWLIMYLVPVMQITGCSRSVALKTNISDGFSWHMFGGTATHANFIPESFEPPLHPVWREKISASPVPSAIVSGNTLFIATNDGQVHVFLEESGKKRGTVKRRASLSATPLIVGTSLIIAYESGDPTLCSYDLASGDRNWEKAYGPIQAAPLYHDGRIYVAGYEGTLYSLFAPTGEIAWKWTGGELFCASPAAIDTMLIAAGLDGTITAMNAVTGKIVWQSGGDRSFRGSPCIAGDRIFIGTLQGHLLCIALGDGTEVWKYGAGNKIYSTPACDGELVVFGCNDGKIYAVRKKGGEGIWSFQTNGLITCAPLIVGGFVYFGSHDNTLYALDKATGKLAWSYAVEGQITQQPLFTGSRLIVSTNRKLVFAFSSEK